METLRRVIGRGFYSLNPLSCNSNTMKIFCNRFKMKPLFRTMQCLTLRVASCYVLPHNPVNYVNCGSKTKVNLKFISNTATGFNEQKNTNKCWKCGKTINPVDEQFICKCGVLQPPTQNRTYFEVLGVETKFDLDPVELTKKFRSLQTILHPDKFGTKSEVEKENSDMQSALVNKAYQTLNRPLSRGLYLLTLYGQSIEEDEKELDPIFLMDILEKNEDIELLSSLKELELIEQQNDDEINSLVNGIQAAFSGKDIALAKLLVTKLQYMCNIESKLREKKLEINS